jgi:long-chain acyl-CoA synthetase
VIVSGLQHLPADGPFIISPNHQSFIDPFFVNGVLPYRVFSRLFFVGAAEYFETPLTRRLATISNLVPVDPDANLVPAMKASAFGLTHGKVLMLFPEGERSIDGTVKRFKKGAPILSRYLHVPIVPVALKGAFEVWPRNRGFNWRSLLPGARRPVFVAFGPPVTFDGTSSDADAAVALRDRVANMWDALR